MIKKKKTTYTYIVLHRKTALLYHNSSVWLDTLDTSS